MEKNFLVKLITVVVIFFILEETSYSKEKIYLNKDYNRTKLLVLTKGLYEDGFYSLAYTKAKKYLKDYPNDKKNKEALLKIMLYSAIKSKNDDLISDYIDFINKIDISDNFKDRVYATIIKESIKNDERLKKVLEKIIPYVKNKDLKKKFLIALINIYFEDKNYKKIIAFEKIPKEVYLYRLISLYKLGMYKQLIKETDKIKDFPPEIMEKIYYYKALAYYKLGKIDKSIQYFEKLKKKNPEILKILVSYYLRKNRLDKVKKYLYKLSTYNDYLDFSHYLLGYLEDLNKKYDKAFQYYSIASKFNTKYGKLAKERLKELKKAKIFNIYYSVRIALSSSKKNALEFLKKRRLKNCFVRPYKNFYGVYCGKFKYFKSAQNYLELIISKGFNDALIEQIAELKR